MTALVRGLGPVRATGVGLSAMIGAGLFVAIGPVVAQAGSGTRWAVLIAAAVAGCNAASSARLAARHPTSGGTYVFARRRLDPTAGFLAGLVFVVGKTASCAAMALAVGVHLWREHAAAVAIAVVVVLTATNLAGVQRSGDVTLALTVVVVVAVLIAVGSSLGADATSADASGPSSVAGVLGGAALMFFAFAGYARLATLGEEVRDPARTIPWATTAAFVLVTGLYLLATETVLRILGTGSAAGSPRALAEAVETSGPSWAGPLVAFAAVLAAGGALLTLLLGVSRTALAMARDRNLPSRLAIVNGHGVPWIAELVVAGAVVTALPMVGVADVIGLSAACILLYYALTNLAALTLPGGLGRTVAAVGLLGCIALFFSLPAAAVALAAALVGIGTAVHTILLSRR